MGHDGGEHAAGRQALEAEQGAHHGGGDDERNVAGGRCDNDVHDGRGDGRMVRFERGVERAAEEQLFAGAVDERNEQYDGYGAGISGGQHAVEGGADERQMTSDQVADDEQAERGDADNDGIEERSPRRVAIGLERYRSGDERSDRPCGCHQ